MTQSLWQAAEPGREDKSFPVLSSDLRVDVAIIGGGITGITAALLLKRAGKKVAVLEQGRIGRGDTGHTTAHLTEVLDARFYELAENFGEDESRLAAESGRAAIDRIESFIREYGIDCDFERVPGFLFSEKRRNLRKLKREFKATGRLGVQASFVLEVPIPGGSAHVAIRFENQAQFHPLRYLKGLAEHIPGNGSHVFEGTAIRSMQDGEPCSVSSGPFVVLADEVIVATHSPVSNRIILHTKIAAYRSYALALRLKQGEPPRGLFWDTEDPYHYIRCYRDLMIIGGEDHKTGFEVDAAERFARLEHYARAHFDVASVKCSWSGQIVKSVDGLPFIGRNPLSDHVWVATGFSGNGMTLGTLGGMILSDGICAEANRFSALYEPSRIKPLVSAKSYLSENIDLPLCFVGDRLTGSEVKRLADIGSGEGKLMRVDGKKLAVFRDSKGAIHACSAVCTHLGCHVRWNNAEGSWDCPCHGSRFDPEGKVLNGPAMRGLEKVPLEELKAQVGKEAA